MTDHTFTSPVEQGSDAAATVPRKSIRRSTSDELRRYLRGPVISPPARRRVDRGLKPRKLPPTDFGGSLHKDPVDSRSIARRNRAKPLEDLVVQEPWEGSSAQQRLQTLPKSGLWIPAWVAHAAGHPARARLLAWLLAKFEDIDADTKKCRARLLDEVGRRWWNASVSRVAAEVLLDRQAVERGLTKLGNSELIERQGSGSAGTYLRPLTKPLLRSFTQFSSDDSCVDELKLAADELEWYDSMGRSHVMRCGIPGVRVPDSLMIICQCQPGPALLLSHIIFWHSKSRSRIVRDGFLWCAKSLRMLEQELGHGRKAINGWCEWLVAHGLIAAGYWVWDHRRDFDQKTLHLRPVPPAVERALEEHEWDVQVNRPQN